MEARATASPTLKVRRQCLQLEQKNVKERQKTTVLIQGDLEVPNFAHNLERYAVT